MFAIVHNGNRGQKIVDAIAFDEATADEIARALAFQHRDYYFKERIG